MTVLCGGISDGHLWDRAVLVHDDSVLFTTLVPMLEMQPGDLGLSGITPAVTTEGGNDGEEA